MYGPHRVHQLLAQHAFQEVPGRTGLQCAKSLGIAAIGRQNNDSRLGKLAADRRDGLDAIQIRHAQVHQRDIWTVFAEQRDGVTTVGRLRDECHIRLTLNDGSHALPQQGVIVDNE
jgi:hypothetical protein